MVVVLVGCVDSTPTTTETAVTPTPVTSSSRVTGDTLRILYWQAPEILNPHLTASIKDWHISRVTYEPLASFNEDGDLIPFLAAEIPTLGKGVAEDGRSVTWKLRQDVLWSDGVPFTADDVIFTYQYITDPAIESSNATIYDLVASVEKIDNYTIKVNFTDTNPAWSAPFVGIPGMILPEHQFTSADFDSLTLFNMADAGKNILPIGTGAYAIVSFEPQEILLLGNELIQTNKIVFEPNPYYRQEGLAFSKVEIRGGGTAADAARSVLQVGDVDYAWFLQVSADELAEYADYDRGTAVPNFGPFVERIYLNQTDPNQPDENGERSSLQISHPFFNDIRVRQAISLAINREEIAQLYPEGVVTSNVLVAPGNYESNNTLYEYNPEKAKQLLTDAGWVDTDGDGIVDKDGQDMIIVFQTTVNPVRQVTQSQVERALEAIGIEVELKIIDSSIFFGDASNPNTYQRFLADLQEYADGNSNPDPGGYMEWWTCSQIPQEANGFSGENVQRWCNETYDTLHEQSKTEMNPDIREQLFIQMNDMIINDVALIPLVHAADVSGVSNTIEGVNLTPWDSDLWNIHEWRRVSP